MAGGIASSVRATTASTSTGPSWASAAAIAIHLVLFLDPDAPHADGFRHGREVWVLEVCAGGQKAGRHLLELHKAELAVVEDHDLHRQPELRETQEIAHQHAEAAVARERNDLPAGKGGLRADRLRHRIGHGAVPERANEAALAVHRQIARRPYRRQTDIATED